MNFKEAYPQLIKYWDYDKNLITPEEVHYGSRKYKIFLKCEKGHSFEKRPDSYKYLKKIKLNCPECNKTNTQKSFEKSYPQVMKYWDYKKNNENKIYPNKITGGSGKLCYFKCNNGHEIKRKPLFFKYIKKENYKFRCPICSGLEVTEKTRLDKNYPEIAKEWSSKNKLKSNEVSCYSDKKYYWECKHNHIWRAGVSDRTGHRYKNKEGTKCPYCWQHSKSRNELIIYSELHQFFNNVYSTHKILGKHLDIFIEDIQLCIEYDGSHWHKNKLTSDKNRNQLLNKNGIKTIRVRENPLDKIENHDIGFDIKNEDLFNIIVEILKFILKNYNIKKEQKIKIENYIKNNKITNEKFFKEIEDTYRIKKIKNQILFKDYDIKKNKLPLHYYGQGSEYNAYWKCHSCGFEERKKIRAKNKYYNCKKCKKENYKNKGYLNRNINKENYSIKNTHPEILCELPKNKLEELKNLNYTNVEKYFNSTCYSCGYVYKTNLWNKIGVKQSCPNCNFNIYKEKTSLLKDYPFIKEIYSVLNTINLEYTEINYPYKLKWICGKGHTTEETLKKKIENNSCKECEKGKTISEIPRVFKDWNFERNEELGLNPYKLKLGSKKIAHFKCNKASDHEWSSPITNRKRFDCPYCANQRLSITNRFDLNYPEIAKLWNEENKNTPEIYVFGYSKTKHKWNCQNCKKVFEKNISEMIRTNSSCPHCKKYNTGKNKGRHRGSIRKK